MVEYSQPNTHKAFHVGHMRNVAIGNCLTRIYKYLGHNTISMNYYGDEGAHVAKCLWLLKKVVTEQELKNIPDNCKGEFLGAIYSKSVSMLSLQSLTKYPWPHIINGKIKSIDGKLLILDVGMDKECKVFCNGIGYKKNDMVAYIPSKNYLTNSNIDLKENIEGVIVTNKYLGIKGKKKKNK